MNGIIMSATEIRDTAKKYEACKISHIHIYALSVMLLKSWPQSTLWDRTQSPMRGKNAVLKGMIHVDSLTIRREAKLTAHYRGICVAPSCVAH